MFDKLQFIEHFPTVSLVDVTLHQVVMKAIFTAFTLLIFLSFNSTHYPFPGGTAAQNKPLQTQHKEIAITIDDLPGVLDGATDDSFKRLQSMNRQMLNVLKQNQISAIGFVNESRLFVKDEMEARIAILRNWLDAGMTLGNHTFSHSNFNDVSLAQFEDEVIRGETVTRALMRGRGIDKFYLRFPFNHTGDTREKKEGLEIFLRERGYAIAPFTIEHSDYVYSRAYTKALLQSNEKLAERIRNDYLNFLDTSCDYFEQKSREVLGYEPKQILLIHVNQLNAICLEDMVQRLKKRGYSFISLDEALKDKAYQTSDSYIGKFGLSWIFRWALTLNKKIDRSKEPDPPQFVMDLYSAN